MISRSDQQCPSNSANRQLLLLAQSDAKPTIQAFQAPQKGFDGRYFWQFRRGRKRYGGLYTVAERDLLLEHFVQHSEALSPREFGEIAGKILRGVSQ